MNEYLKQVNSLPFYLIVGGVLLFILIMCVVFLVKSYRAGIAIGMDKKVMRRAIMSSATFSVLPAVSILLGVIALSGSLGVPLSWLRLSVVGALAATGMGLSGLKVSELSIAAFTTIALVMTAGILSGITCCIFGLKKYLGKVQKKEKMADNGRPGFGTYATIAMFIGLCSAYIGSYVGTWTAFKNSTPLLVAGISGLAMAVFEYLIVKKKMEWLENFSIAVSMIIGMAAAVLMNL